MAHIFFVDSSATGLRGVRTALRLGHDATLAVPRSGSMLSMMKVAETAIRESVGENVAIVYVDDMDADLLDVAAKANESRPIDVILTTSEIAVIPTARLAERFRTPYDPVLALEKAVQKDRCRSILKENNIRSTKHAIAYDVETAAAALQYVGYPAVIKPTRGVAKEASAILHAPENLTEFFSSHLRGRTVSEGMEGFVSSTFVVESYVFGNLHSAELIVADGRVQLLATTRRERATHNPLLEVSAAMPGGLSGETEKIVVDYMQDVFTALGLRIGIYHVEFILSDLGPVLVEINPRMMGGISPIMYENLTGEDPYELLINLYLTGTVVHPLPTISRGGAVVAIGAPEGGELPNNAPDIVRSIMGNYEMFANTLRIQGGAKVERYQGNFSILGFVGIFGETGLQALANAGRFITQLEEGLDIGLAKIADPFGRAH